MPASPTQVVAAQVRRLRDRHGWTAQQLADKMTEAGIAWNRAIVAKLETGRRSFVTVDEVMALAYVLDVAPVHLLVPIENGLAPNTQLRITSSVVTVPGAARAWIRGQMHIGGQDARIYYSEVPKDEWTPPNLSFRPGGTAEADDGDR